MRFNCFIGHVLLTKQFIAGCSLGSNIYTFEKLSLRIFNMLSYKWFLLPVRGEGHACPVLDTGMRGDKNERHLTSILSPGGEKRRVFKSRVKISNIFS